MKKKSIPELDKLFEEIGTYVQVQNTEKNLETIISQFEEMKKDLLFILSESSK